MWSSAEWVKDSMVCGVIWTATNSELAYWKREIGKNNEKQHISQIATENGRANIKLCIQKRVPLF